MRQLALMQPVQQIFAPLICGSRLVIFSNEVRRDPSLFVQSVIRYDGNVLDITPGHFNLLLNAECSELISKHLRFTIVAGEPLNKTH